MSYPKRLQKVHSDLLFLHGRMKIGKARNLYLIFMTRKNRDLHKRPKAGL